MLKRLSELLRGDLLIQGSREQWIILGYLALWAFIMIASSNLVDQKVYRISKLQGELREVSAEFVEQRSALMKMKMETQLLEALAPKGFERSMAPPQKIIVKD